MDKFTCHQKLGQAGESFAADWLRARGFQIKFQNYHGPAGEIDLIAFDPQQKYFLMVEVKTRSHDSGLAAIDNRKVRRMQKAAEHYFFQHLGQRYVPDYELWGLGIKAVRQRLEVVDWIPLELNRNI